MSNNKINKNKFFKKVCHRSREIALNQNYNITNQQTQSQCWNLYRPRFEDERSNDILKELVKYDYVGNKNKSVIEVITDVLSDDELESYKKELAQDFEQQELKASTQELKASTQESLDTLLAKRTDKFLTSKIDNYYSSKSKDNIKEYKVVHQLDDISGGTNVIQLEAKLNELAILGWRIVTIHTNELGKNSSAVAANGISLGKNSTIDELIIVLERDIPKELLSY